MKMDNSSALVDDMLSSPKQKCANCGHSITIYKHVMSSESLIFHDENGLFSRSCRCGCKSPRVKDGKEKISR